MKKLTKIGILVFVMSLFVIYASTASFQSSVTGSNIQEMSILPHNTLYTSFTLTNFTIVGFFYYSNSTPVNFLLINQSAFSSMSSQINSGKPINGSLAARSGALELIYNSTYGIFPYSELNSTKQDVYTSNSSPILPAGNYYAVFENPGQSSVRISYSAILKTQSGINSTILSTAAYGLTGAALFFGGIVIMLYSVLAKPKKEELKVDEEAASLYAKQASRRRRTSRVKKGKAKK